MKKEHREHICILTPEDSHIDAQNFNLVRENLLMGAKEESKIILDLSQVSFVDSAGLGGTILTLVRTISGRGGKIALATPQPSVETLFDMVRIHKVVPVYDSMEEALDSLGPPL